MRSSLSPKDNQALFFLFLAQMCQVILIFVSMKAVLVPVLIKGTNVISTKCRMLSLGLFHNQAAATVVSSSVNNENAIDVRNKDRS